MRLLLWLNVCVELGASEASILAASSISLRYCAVSCCKRVVLKFHHLSRLFQGVTWARGRVDSFSEYFVVFSACQPYACVWFPLFSGRKRRRHTPSWRPLTTFPSLHCDLGVSMPCWSQRLDAAGPPPLDDSQRAPTGRNTPQSSHPSRRRGTTWYEAAVLPSCRPAVKSSSDVQHR